MFCGNCGTENANEAKFCKVCGSPLTGAPVRNEGPVSEGGNMQAETPAPETYTTPTPETYTQTYTAPTPETYTQTYANGAPVNAAATNQGTNQGKKLPMNMIIGGCIAIIAIIAIIFIGMNSGKAIDLNKYVVMEAEGYDGYGTVSASIDWEAIEKKYGKKISYTKAAKNEYGGLINLMTPMELVQESVSIHFEENGCLSNGDVVPYTWEVDDELSKCVNCKVKYKDDKYKVSGLTEVGTFDAFANLDVTFYGIAPFGSVELNYNGSELDTYDFSCDKTDELCNGDVIKVTIDSSRMESLAQNLGMVPAQLEKEYTVGGLESYLTNLSELTDVAMDSMQRQAQDVFLAYVAQNWGEGADLESFTYIGDYLLTTKGGEEWGANNFLYLVYKAQVRNRYSNDEKKYNKVNDVYWYIGYENLMLGSDGNVNVDVTAYTTPSDGFSIDSGVSDGWWGTQSWYYYGYPTLDDLYKSVVTVKMDSYYHEDNVDESVAPVSVAQPEEPEAEEAEVGEDGFIFPNSDTEYLSKADLEGLTKEECQIARNEIYARHGRKFKDEALQKHFDSCDWYEGTISPSKFSESVLSDIEIANRDLIVEYEEENGYR